MMMKMHGLGDGAYWLVTYAWFWLLYVVYMAIFIAFGSAIGLNMFTKNSLGVQARAGEGGGRLRTQLCLLRCPPTQEHTQTRTHARTPAAAPRWCCTSCLATT